MGASGCGKTTIGRALALKQSWAFVEGDDLHPSGNIAKMSAGLALSDTDRGPWLENIRAALNQSSAETIVLACSALTPFVQGALRQSTGRRLTWVHLQASAEYLHRRLDRRDHFMPVSLLDSQLEALDPPPEAVTVDAVDPVDALIEQITALVT